MKQGHKLTWGWYLGSAAIVLAASVFLFVSVWRHIDSEVERSIVAIEDPGAVLNDLKTVGGTNQMLGTHEPLPQLTFLPHHPFYMARMIYQRVILWLTVSPLEKVKLYEQYADERMGVAAQLLALGKGRESIEAATKGYMYMLQAAETLRDEEGKEVDELWTHLAQAAMAQEQVLLVLHESVTDTLKPKVEALAEGMERIRKEALQEALTM